MDLLPGGGLRPGLWRDNHARSGFLNPEYLAPEVTVDEIAEQANVRLWHDKLHDGSGPGAEFRGWLEPDQIVSPDELDRLIATGE